MRQRGGGELGWVGWVGRIPLIEFKNPRFPFHVFQKILIPYSRFSRFDKTDLKNLSARVFPNIFEVWEFEISPNSNYRTWLWIAFALRWVIWWIQSQEELFKGSWTFPPVPKVMQMKACEISRKCKIEMNSALWMRILLQHLSPFNCFCNNGLTEN